jgi:hypothetical protein
MKKKTETKTKTRTINLGSNYINFLKASKKYSHLPYPEYKKKIAQELGYIKK